MRIDPRLESIQLALAFVRLFLSVGIEKDDRRESLDGNSLRKSVGGGIHLGDDHVVIILEGGTQLIVDGGKFFDNVRTTGRRIPRGRPSFG